MKNLLFVDDEKTFLLSLSEGLSTYREDFNILTAEDGKKAMTALESLPIDLVVTDLKMPVADGFELLAYMSKKHSHIPVMVMTAYATPEIEKRLHSYGIVNYIEKPLNLLELADRISEELAASSDGHINGITLAAFLQLMEMEKKTATLKIASCGKKGCLYFTKGELTDAETGHLSGEEAACDIICWDNPEIEIERAGKKRNRSITSTLQYILMEAFRLKDEKARRLKGYEAEEFNEDSELIIDSPGQTEEIHPQKEKIMALEHHLQGLKEIKGYKASGVMNYTGEMLASDSIDPNIDLTLVGATFNDIFRSAHEASKKIGLEACKETVISTPKGIVVLRCSGVDAKSHFHLIGIMASDGNQALMKMQVEKMVSPIMDELA
ncbi:MAG: response regulator [Nitrospirae bacterium]|nr:response regulator [Nitrospirota bacterium]